jgi:hypothetical protein
MAAGPQKTFGKMHRSACAHHSALHYGQNWYFVSKTVFLKSLYKSCAGRLLFCTRTENVIRAGFGPVGSTVKKVWANYEQLLRAIFQEQKIYFLKKKL